MVLQRRLCGGQGLRANDWLGSTAGLHELNLAAVELSVEMASHTADDQTRHARPRAVLHDRRLSGKLKIITSILEAPVIKKILMHLGLQARAPSRSPARGHAMQAASRVRSLQRT